MIESESTPEDVSVLCASTSDTLSPISRSSLPLNSMVNDGHDTSPKFFSNWVEYFLPPLLEDSKFNSTKTLIVLSFDENEDYGSENKIMTIAMGGALPVDKRNTTEDMLVN